MDGYLPVAASPGAVSSPISRQQTLNSAIGCTGTGLHSGRTVQVTLLPAPADAGVTFRRTDLGLDIPARFDRVADTRLCTVLAHKERRDATRRHRRALDGRAGRHRRRQRRGRAGRPGAAGAGRVRRALAVPARLRRNRACRTRRGRRSRCCAPSASRRAKRSPSFGPARAGALELQLAIDFAAPAIGRQALSLTLRPDLFREVARARTFTQLHEIEGLRAAGLAKGGTLDNAVVVDGARVLNPCGLRMPDEFVRHKLLDAVGDLALAGKLRGRFVGHRSGHALNNRILRALFADPANWRTVPGDGFGWMRDAA